MTTKKGNQLISLVRQHPLDAVLRDYLLDCQAGGLAPKTVQIYRYSLTAFTAFVKGLGVQAVTAIQPTHIRAFLTEWQEGHRPGGVHLYYRSLKTFLRWAVREGLIDTNPIDRVRPPRVDQEPLEPVGLDVFNALLAACDKSEYGLRDRAMLMVLLDSGLRAGELVALNVGDVDLSDGAVLVRRSKSRKPRTTFIGGTTRKAVARYLRTRGNVGPDDPLWVYEVYGEQKRLRYWGLREVIRRRAREAGVPAPQLHAFRRAFAIMSLRNGADPVSLSRMLGHGSLPVILRYLKQQASDLAQVHQATSPIDRLRR